MEENLNKNSEPEIFTIPEEFYGAQKKASASLAVTASSRAASPVSAAVAVPAAPRVVKKTGLNFSSSKFIITATAVLLVLAVSGFSYYYIRQAQIARQKLTEAQKKQEPAAAPSPEQSTAPVVPAPVVPEPPVSVTTTEPAVPQPVSLAVFPFKNYTQAEDADNDGLTTVEEALYGTAVDIPDTDEDGFPDGLEVSKAYNPSGFKPVKLLDSGKVKAYLNPTYNYSVLNPLTWPAQALDANNEQVIFSSDTGEFIEIIVEDNPLKLSVSDWYLGQSPGVAAEDLKPANTKDNLAGILSPDGLSAF